MKTAYLNLRHGVPERRAAWHAGLERCGFNVVDVDAPGSIRPKRDSDILISWNRHIDGAQAADRFMMAGCHVLITENATWGNDFSGDHWYTVCRDYHNVRGTFPIGDSQRWDTLDVELGEWRTIGETVVLASRGIGPIAHRQPTGWPEHAQRVYDARIRRHPGRYGVVKPLLEDLACAGMVVTWGSGSAVLALMAGIPVVSNMPRWIAEQDNTDAGRLAMLRRLAWAQWRISEIADGEPIVRLLGMK